MRKQDIRLPINNVRPEFLRTKNVKFWKRYSGTRHTSNNEMAEYVTGWHSGPLCLSNYFMNSAWKKPLFSFQRKSETKPRSFIERTEPKDRRRMKKEDGGWWSFCVIFLFPCLFFTHSIKCEACLFGKGANFANKLSCQQELVIHARVRKHERLD